MEVRPPSVPEGAAAGAPPEEEGERPGVEADAFAGEGGEVLERRRQGAMGAVVVESSDEAGGGGRPAASGGSSRRGCDPAIHRRPTPAAAVAPARCPAGGRRWEGVGPTESGCGPMGSCDLGLKKQKIGEMRRGEFESVNGLGLLMVGSQGP